MFQTMFPQLLVFFFDFYFFIFRMENSAWKKLVVPCDRMATDGLCDRLDTCDPFGVVVAGGADGFHG